MKIKSFIILALTLFPLILVGNWKQEKLKIDFLLNKVAQLEGKFVRNGSEHKANAAVKHLKMKLENAMDSWFAPDKDEWTVIMFIEKVASKSSLSGNKYFIKFKPDSLIPTETWLKQKLETYRR